MDETLTLGEILTLDEIEARYAPDWVLIVEPVIEEGPRLLGGKVAFHSPDRDAVYRKAIELRPGRCAVRYLGEWPTDVEFLL